MSRRSTQRSQVSGPNSALTSFLREKGIDTSGIQALSQARARARNEAALRRSLAAEARAAEAAEAAEEVDEDDEVGESSASAARRKKKKKRSEDEDEEMLDFEEEEEEEPVKTRRGRSSRATTEIKLKVVGKRKRKSTAVKDTESEFEEVEEEEIVTVRATRTRKPTKAQLAKKKAEEQRQLEEDDEFNPDNFLDPAFRPAPGQIAFCADCECRFTVTPYSRSADDGEGLLCHTCGKKGAPAEKAARKKKQTNRTNKKSTARAILDGDTSAVKSLQEICINTVAKYIDDVETLGYIGSHNVDKISQIICKNRRLNGETIGLFFEPAEHVLRFYDCSKIPSDTLRQIGAFVPTLRRLHLNWCGLMKDECLDYYGTQLKQLTSLELCGAFNVTEECYIRFFKNVGSRLTEFVIKDTSRFKVAAMEALVDNCPELEVLRLHTLTFIDDECVRLLTGLPNLKVLEITDSQTSITDGPIIDCLNTFGPGLSELTLNGCRDLTDATLEAIHSSCGRLDILNLDELDFLTNDGISKLFTEWSLNYGLKELSLRDCVNLQSSGFARIIDHSGRTLEKLSINKCKDVNKDAWTFLQEFTLPELETLDISFVRCVDDAIVEGILKVAPELKTLKIWGCHKITEACGLREGMLLVGREADILA
ncbi:hypothetical protein TWF506_010016 [Arthrobotrys conoides]|uniref:DNA repair protein rhp7 treble clef domain-containing protein n=1 Tax=Arthrobotrys conoides TaxID=74498 RepID=A0AAN8RLR3_9PEZI